MTTLFERRVAEAEVEVAKLAGPDRVAEFLAVAPWVDWVPTLELLELEGIYRRSEEEGAMPPADEARAMSIAYGAEARRLAEEPRP